MLPIIRLVSLSLIVRCHRTIRLMRSRKNRSECLSPGSNDVAGGKISLNSDIKLSGKRIVTFARVI